MLDRRRSRQVLTLVAAAWLVASDGGAGGYRETDSFEDVSAAVEEYVQRRGAESVLLAVDIDNTLLAMRDDLGSDQWFEWQEYLLEHEPDSTELVADSFDALLEVQGVLFDRGRMRPPEPRLPEIIDEIQRLGVKTLVLTSRGDEFRRATVRELAAAGYDFASTALRADGIARGPYPPYRADEWRQSGLTADEAEIFNLAVTPRPISYGDGVMMVAGQHKGAMLLSILHDAEWTPGAVVYVDDHGRHVHRVLDALARRGVEATVFHYHREDDNVKRFRYGDKSEVARSWLRLKRSLEMPRPAERREAAAAAVSR